MKEVKKKMNKIKSILNKIPVNFIMVVALLVIPVANQLSNQCFLIGGEPEMPECLQENL